MSARNTPWLTVKNESDGGHTMIISGKIGKSWWDDSGTSSKEFRNEFDKIPKGKKVQVRINSEGGSIKDGLEIYNTLKQRRADVTCYVDGYAVSIASIIALGGSKTVSPKSSIWMIHEPWSYTQGNAEDHLRSAEMLDKHGDMLAAIYSDETGKSKSEMREAMKSETWFTGDEATEYGLADETPAEDLEETMAGIDLSQFANVPDKIKNILEAAPKGAKTSNAARSDTQSNPPVTGSASALSADQNDGGQNAGTAASNVSNKTKGQTMEPTTPAAVNPPANELADLKAQLASERRARLTQTVNSYVDAQKITKDEVNFYVSCAITDEAGTLAALEKRTAARTGGDPVGHNITVLAENPLDRISKLPTAGERYAAYKKDWEGIFADALKRDIRGDKYLGPTPHAVPEDERKLPVNANTFSATLTTSFLLDGATTVLQNRWAPLMAFTRDFSTDPYKPLATAVAKLVTVTTAAQTDATNFEAGNGDTVAPVSVTMHQYTKNFSVTNSELNSGLRMENLIAINAAGIADKIISLATAPITVANFETTGGNTSLVAAPGSFGFSDLATLWGQLKKSPIKNILLDGEYMARILNVPTFFQMASTQPGGGWKAFGWDYIALNTIWTGAGTNVRGFACNPQAITCVAGLPLTPPNIPGNTLQESRAVVPDVGITIAAYSWFSLASRTAWMSYDLMFGAQVADTTAGIVIKSA